MALFEGVRQRSGGRLRVTSDRDGAEVSINGRPRGHAPYSGKVAVGRIGRTTKVRKITMP